MSLESTGFDDLLICFIILPHRDNKVASREIQPSGRLARYRGGRDSLPSPSPIAIQLHLGIGILLNAGTA